MGRGPNRGADPRCDGGFGTPAASLAGRSDRLGQALVARRRRARLAPRPPLVAVALDLAREVLRAEVDRVRELARGLPAAQRDPLEVQGRLGHLVLGDRGVALLEHLDLETGELGHLLAHLREALLDALAQLVADGEIAALDV